ncbi:MAG: hypothetical protein IJ131_08975 [Eggerthellaceae bacterium]|nr:hypothetical protein [Eggerthellaceae bacterium]
MKATQNIIDVEPVSYSGYRGQARPAYDARQRQGTSYYRGSYAWDDGQTVYQGTLPYEPAARYVWSPFSALLGIIQVFLGLVLIAVGVPLLLLPGPGLLTIALGVLLASRGIRKVFGFRSAFS